MVITQGSFGTLESISTKTVTTDNSLYQYFLTLIETKPSSEVLDKLHLLLAETEYYPDVEVQKMVKNIVCSPNTKGNCLSFLNNICQICIVYWIVEEDAKSIIYRLLNLFKELNLSEKKPENFIERWQEESQAFSGSSEYLKLQRLSHIINPLLSSDAAKPKVLGDLLGRYPFLYKGCLADHYSLPEYINFLAGFKRHQQNSFQEKFNRTIVLQKQKIEVARLRSMTSKIPQPIQVVPNPTLLNHQAFRTAVETFIQLTPSRIKNQTIFKLFFQIKSSPFKIFKIWLINYLTEGLKEESKQQLNPYLQANIPTILTDCDAQPLNGFLIIRTCNQLLNQLILNPEFLTKSAITKHRSLTGSGFEQSDRRFLQPTVCCQILS